MLVRFSSAVARWGVSGVQHLEALFLPRMCLVCEGAVGAARDQMVCDRCWNRVAQLPSPRCERCGHPQRGESCRWCPVLPAHVRAVRSFCWVPGGAAERMVHAFKYDGWHRLADEMAARMARLQWPPDVREEGVALVPVPLAPDRLRRRGYNQSAVLAHALARALATSWPLEVWEDVIVRTRSTGTQTQLTPDQRLRNVAAAFEVGSRAPSKLSGAHVILVDDVVTTAATLNECAATLWGAGARIISYVTFGRARAAGDAPLTRG